MSASVSEKMNSTHHLTNSSTHSPSPEIAIRVDHVSKKYCKSLKRSMVYGVKDIGRNTLGLSSNSGRLRKDEFWAVDDVSFEVKKGETLGIIGPNGSGKTTLLKMLNGIFWPDRGKITIRGKTGALIAVGTGFHPLLTGRENIYINGAILGLSKKEIDKKLEDIIEFADIGDFIDAPVKFYSSGMFVRLGFSVAINIEPEVLLIDEVLAVGDIGFRNKCLRKLHELKKQAAATVFVSHQLEYLRSICDEVLVMDRGINIYYGEVDTGIVKYQEVTIEKQKKDLQFHPKGAVHLSSGKILFVDSGILNKFGKKVNEVKFDDELTLFFDFELKSYLKQLIFQVAIFNSENVKCLASWSNDERNGTDKKYQFTNLAKGKYRLIVNYREPRLTSGIYQPKFEVRNPITSETYEKIKQMAPFVIQGNVIHRGVIKANSSWKLEVL